MSDTKKIIDELVNRLGWKDSGHYYSLDNELAYRVVAQGVGIYLIQGHPMQPDHQYEIGGKAMPAYDFVRDDRVAAELMRRCSSIYIEDCTDGVERVKKYACRADHSYGNRTREWYVDESQARAIILACVEDQEA